MEKFNEAVRTGVEPEFNRASFAGDFINPNGNPGIFEAPFYAGARAPAAHITKGGLKVNTSAEVLALMETQFLDCALLVRSLAVTQLPGLQRYYQ
ncbi:MAG: FAD-binding protein [Oscillospiraceae bacterium]|nr:FAD-binding protein [Oscillospiraceae bacterium]